MPRTLNLLCAGAAQGLVTALGPLLSERLDLRIEGRFGAVGAIKEAFEAGEACDVLISSEAMVRAMIGTQDLQIGSAAALGQVFTGVAVPKGREAPRVDTPEALAEALLAATSLWVPDMAKSTAGQHFKRMIADLGLSDPLAARIRMFPNGATAMREMGDSHEPGALGCTQVTEIVFTPRVTLVALLPSRFELATVYSAAVCARSSQPELSRALIELLVSAEQDPLARRCGFSR
jgi:molybdate transport system substrate-binding protein